MKLSDRGYSIEAGEYFRGCQEIPAFPDAPFAASEFNAGRNLVKIIPAKLAAFENTMFNNVDGGAEIYARLVNEEFYYILVMTNENIEGSFVPDDIFSSANDAEAYALLHHIEYAAVR